MFVAFTLPGETVRLGTTSRRGDGVAGDAGAILSASADRVVPPCPHFGTCGGCVLQHWGDAPYANWKWHLLANVLRRSGYPDAEPSPLVRTSPSLRRRMDFAVRRDGADIMLGLHRHRSRDVIDLQTCLVLDPVLVALLPPLRVLLRKLNCLRREGSAVLNMLDSGPDLLLRVDGAMTTPDRTALSAFANAHGLPRISVATGTEPPETACLLRPATTMLGGVPVIPPPGAFLQASPPGEAAIVAAVIAGIPEKRFAKSRVAELYAGSGTLTFAIARHVRVDAFEGDAASAAALKAAADTAVLTGRITVARRDLVRQPLSAKELSTYVAVVLDPPHAGAATQIALVASSTVRRVIYVSCNPVTLGRDAEVLQRAGFKLLSAVPIDQFIWSARLETVCVFGR